MRAVPNPYSYCSICGAEYGASACSHSCNPRILAARDAANTRANNQQYPEVEDAIVTIQRPVGERILHGLQQMEEDGYFD